MNLRPRLSRDGKLDSTDRGWILSIPSGPVNRYRLSQLDDHVGLARSKYPYRPPFGMQVEARVSSAAIPGTWGFGLWNDPYGFSLGPGNGFIRLPALPNAAWFFFSSPASYLSFRDDRPANGLLAQVFASPKFDPLLFRIALTAPFSFRLARRLLARVVREDARRLDAAIEPPDAATLPYDVTQWHKYALEWAVGGTRFDVDNVRILDTPVSPRPPLGLVIWIDNQRAGFDPRGRLSYGLEPNPEPAWLEIRNLHID